MVLEKQTDIESRNFLTNMYGYVGNQPFPIALF